MTVTASCTPVWRRNRAVHLVVRGQLTLSPDVVFEPGPVRSHAVVARGAHLSIGERVSVGFGCGLSCDEAIDIGADVSIGPYVQLLDSDLHVAWQRDERAAPLPIVIGEGAIIGAWSIVLPGARIGAHARVRPGSVVSGDIDEHSDVSGNPARPLSTHATVSLDDPSAAILAVVGEVFGLGRPATESTRRSDIARWNSLGALRLLVALEDACGVRLPEEQVAVASDVRELIALVLAALQG